MSTDNLGLADRLVLTQGRESLSKSERMLARSLVTFFIGSLVFLLIDLYLDLIFIVWLSVSQLIGAVIYFLLLRRGHTWLTGILSHSHAMIVIFLIAAVFSSASLVHVLLIPTVISLVAVFGSSRRKTIFGFVVFIMVALSALEFGEVRISPVDLPHHTLDVTKTINFIGALLMSYILIDSTIKVSERAQAEVESQQAELRSKNELLLSTLSVRDKLVSTLSHDVRSPLNNILAALSLLEAGKISNDEWKMLSSKLRPQTQDTLDFIDDMMKWISGQQGKLQVNPIAYGTENINNGVVDLIKPLAAAKHINFKVVVDSDTDVQADVQMINSVLRNLLTNAVKFTPIGGHISLLVKRTGNIVRFAIANAGRGLSAVEVEKINSGVMFSSIGTANEKGHGLGLPLSIQFLKMHNASLKVESGINANTIFSFELPANNLN
jgi:signal transduction histidine kinase